MGRKRFGVVLSVLVSSALALSGCVAHDGKARGSGAGSSDTVLCGGKKALKASGSTAQTNAMTRFTTAFDQVCPGPTLDYTANGSGAGIGQFTGNQTDFAGSDSINASA